MSVTAILGCMWGDEGKAKIVDVLAEKHDAIIRFQGGANAGHTIKADGEQFILHTIPSGVLYKDKLCVQGGGMVLNPFQVLEEIDQLKARGIKFDGRFFIDKG
ncbi:MAG: adenylosuccinate synthetase, partial [Candidatus Cloacimonetes bacterium]|nr:adenylosuccinate synthetase [Candidatus Cloacimonadota bacterium]